MSAFSSDDEINTSNLPMKEKNENPIIKLNHEDSFATSIHRFQSLHRQVSHSKLDK